MPEAVHTFTYRGEITKESSVRFISHLDFAGLFERALCRAKLPVVYSEGFNPHMKLSFASALALGVTSDSEYMEFILSKEISQPEVFDRLRAQLPQGVQLKQLKLIEGKHKALMALADEARYKIALAGVEHPEAWSHAVDAFNSMESCVFQRKTPKKVREIDLKQYLLGKVQFRADELSAELTVSVKITPQGSIKPAEILEFILSRFELSYDTSDVEIRRTELLCSGKALMDAV